jgi:cholesterol transport system auxiliary component
MKFRLAPRGLTRAAVALAFMLVSGCSGLLPKPAPQPTYYALDAAASAGQLAPVDAQRSAAHVELHPAAADAPSPSAAAAETARSDRPPSLVINPPRAAAGFDSQRIIYLRQAHQLEYFAQSQWIDTPARMLAPQLVAALEATGSFDAVLLSSTGASSDLRLDVEILKLQQDFTRSPSEVHFMLRTYVVDSSTRRVLARRDFAAAVTARSDDPYGGVVAANAAVKTVLEQLAAFCADAVQGWRQTYRPVPPLSDARRYPEGIP